MPLDNGLTLLSIVLFAQRCQRGCGRVQDSSCTATSVIVRDKEPCRSGKVRGDGGVSTEGWSIFSIFGPEPEDADTGHVSVSGKELFAPRTITQHTTLRWGQTGRLGPPAAERTRTSLACKGCQRGDQRGDQSDQRTRTLHEANAPFRLNTNLYYLQ